ncbi:MAG TPA: hypothetical protein VHE32_05640 [Rhodanobacteraceae bacterium]|jgi:hypothetical protein|nr:hypothetical protein [Rhodanobacteraceae bacterium]
MTTEIHRADPQLRRVALRVIGAAALAALLALIAFRHWLDRTAETVPADAFLHTIRRTIGISSIACGLCVLVLAACAARLGRRVIAHRRWPLPSARVLRDTPVRSGNEAIAFGRLLGVAAIALVIASLAFGVLGWRCFAP